MVGTGVDDVLRMYAWSVDSKSLRIERTVNFPIAPILESLGKKSFNPSALSFSPDEKRLLILAARQESYAVFEWENSMKLLSATELPNKKLHRQSEGLAIDRDGRMFIADEGQNKRARLGVYSSVFEP